jgi:cytochrome c-type biogenesis protein CcmF
LGAKVPLKNGKGEINKDYLMDTNYEAFKVVTEIVQLDNGQELRKGDTIKINKENVYYEIAVRKGNDQFILKPRLQNNPNMEYVASPDIHSFWYKDIYVHVSNFPDPTKIQWSTPDQINLIPDESISYKGVELKLISSSLEEELEGFEMNKGDMAIVANIEIADGVNTYLTRPVYMIKNGRVRLYPDENKALGLRSVIQGIDPKSGQITLAISSSQRDWITIKAKEMPMISLVWIGTLIMVFGIVVMVYQKIQSPQIQTSLFMRVIYRNKEISHTSYLEEKTQGNKQSQSV